MNRHRQIRMKISWCFLLVLSLPLLIVFKVSAQSTGPAATAILHSEVVSAATGHAIGGALVKLGSGTSSFATNTDGSGRFRILDIPSGEYTLSITAIGFENFEQTVSVLAGNTKLPTLSLVDLQVSLEEVVVYGTRSAQAAALNKQRAAHNISNVISADQAGKFPADTAADALRRVPGISFQRQERSGEGEFISIRGLDAGLNNVKINGVNSGQSNAGSRRVPFSVFQADSIAEITVHKTLLPDQDGEGIGGSVELDTATPLRRGKDTLIASLEGRDNDFVDKTGYRFGITGSKIFADDTFGVLASFTSRKRYQKVFQFDVLGDWLPSRLPLDGNGVPIEDFPDLPNDIAFLESDSFEMEDIRYNVFEDERENFSTTLALEWRPLASTTLALIYNDNQEEVQNTRQNVGFEQSDDFTDTDQDGNLIAPDGSFFYHGSRPFLHINMETEDVDVSNRSLSFQGESILDRWELEYGLGLARAETKVPLSKELNFLIRNLDRLGYVPANVGPTGRSYIDFDIASNSQVPRPLLTPAGFQAVTDPSQYAFADADIDTRERDDERVSGRFDATYLFNRPHLRAIKVGTKFETASRLQLDIEFWDDDGVGPDGTIGGDDNFTLADTNLYTGGLVSYGPVNTPVPNIPGILEASRSGIEAFGNTLVSGVDISQLDPSDVDIAEYDEDIAAAYVMGDFEWGAWSMIAGARVERQSLDINVAGFTQLDFIDDSRDVDIAGARVFQSSSSTEVLPRLQINYRPQSDLVFRSAIYTALARPQFSALGGVRNIGFSEEDLRLVIFEGNPNLDPSYATAFDLGVESYTGRVGVMALNLFYKRIEDFAFNNEFSDFGRDGSTFDITSIPGLENVDPSTLDIIIGRPQNGETATVKGIELTFVRQFPTLPGFWGGFGLYTNGTLQDTEVDLVVAPGFVRRVPFFNSPEYTGTVAITYEKYGLDATLSYSFQDRQLDSVEFYQVDEWEQPYDSLDLSAKYTLPFSKDWFAQTTLFLQVADLTDRGSNKPINWETRGRGSRLVDDVEYDGRTIRFGITAQF